MQTTRKGQPLSEKEILEALSNKKSRRRPFLIEFVLLFGLVIFVGGVLIHSRSTAIQTPVSPTAAPIPTDLPTIVPTQAINCAKVKGPFNQKGTKILQSDGTPYIPYGTTVPGLAHPDYQYYVVSDNAQIQASAVYWCANTVRLQVAQDILVGKTGKDYNPDFMDVIESEVSFAESYGLVVVINAQTEDTGYEPGPTNATRAFWDEIIKIYGKDPQVVLDLFNEPRYNIAGEAATWQLWQQGGVHNGTTYLGMQNLIDEIRTEGSRNLLWVEGPYTANTLARVSSYPINGGNPLMYEIHHPNGAHTPSVWESDFGYLVTKNIAPVVDGEWSNYAAAKSECWPDALTAAPQFLSYLKSKQIGMTVWSLRTGVMVKSSDDLSVPTTINSNWACKDGLDQGAGSLVMDWYRKNNSK